MMFQTKLASWRDAPMKSLRPESIPSTPMKSPHLCRFNPYICPNKHKFYSLVQSTEINLDIKLNPFIIQPSSIILYLQPWWSAFSTDLFQSIPASLRPELPSADPCNAGNLLHLFLQDAAHLKDAAGENQPASGGQWPLGIWENGGWSQLHIKLHIYIYIYIWVIKTWVKKPWVIKTMGCKAQIEDMGSKDNGFQ